MDCAFAEEVDFLVNEVDGGFHIQAQMDQFFNQGID